MNNSMLTIQLYRFAGTWAFTDEARELMHEPFVLGMPKIIDKVLKDNNIVSDQPKILFSAKPFPFHQGYLHYKNFESGGVWYDLFSRTNEDKKYVNQNLTGWLCPATLKYFPVHPEYIYFKLEA
jgi:hypothetical protein